jgi:hypothetical protein
LVSIASDVTDGEALGWAVVGKPLAAGEPETRGDPAPVDAAMVAVGKPPPLAPAVGCC